MYVVFHIAVLYTCCIWNIFCTWWFLLSASQSFHFLWNMEINEIGFKNTSWELDPKAFKVAIFFQKIKNVSRNYLLYNLIDSQSVGRLFCCRWGAIIVSFKAWTTSLKLLTSVNNNSCSQSMLLPAETRFLKVKVHWCWTLGAASTPYRTVKERETQERLIE